MSANDQSIPTHQTVSAEVADFLGKSQGAVREALVKSLTNREVARRVEALDKALVKRKELQKEIEKIRPKKVFNPDGTEAAGTFTSEEFQSLKKAKEKLAKFEGQLEKAFGGDASAFDNLSKGGDQPEQS